MVAKRDKITLDYIIKHCKNIEEDLNGLTREEFDKDRKTQNSLCFDILQIGELVKSLSPNLLNEHDDIPWKKIKGMRDWVVHGYKSIDMDTIWDTSHKDIKPLRKCCELILEVERIKEGEKEDINFMPQFDPNEKW